MNRSRVLFLALLAGALVVPVDASAQEPKDDKYTREASKQLGVAMLRQDDAERRQAYQEALTTLEEGMVREADNPKIWFLAGQAYAGLLDFAGADSSFDRALAMYPDYAAEVEAEREVGWMNGFNAAVVAMDTQDYDEAIRLFEGAHEMYPKRPEHLLNMASIYANQGDTERAVWAYEEALVAIDSDRFAELDADGQAQWKSFEEMAVINLSQMRGQAGVDAFQAENYEEAIALFGEAAESNPYSRDFRFNVVQARFAQAQAIEETRDTAIAPGEAPQDAQLMQLYQALPADVASAREMDPNNENLMLIWARATRRNGELTGNIEEGQQSTLRVLEQLQAMPATVSQLIVAPGEGTATVTGMAKNNGQEPGTTVNIAVKLFANDGAEIGTQSATVTLGEADAETEFRVTVPGVDRQIAGWSYVVTG